MTAPSSTRGSEGSRASDAFYASIEPVDSFEKLAFRSRYVALPDDWAVIAADLDRRRDARELAYGLHVRARRS